MVCSKCGAELKEGCVYCSQCGQEAQIVSEINILEDDLLREIMDDGEQEKKENSGQKKGNSSNPEKKDSSQTGKD